MVKEVKVVKEAKEVVKEVEGDGDERCEEVKEEVERGGGGGSLPHRRCRPARKSAASCTGGAAGAAGRSPLRTRRWSCRTTRRSRFETFGRRKVRSSLVYQLLFRVRLRADVRSATCWTERANLQKPLRFPLAANQ